MDDNKIIVDIYSDFVCPFCYMGKKNLKDAIKNLGFEDIVEVNYKSYELDEDAPSTFSVLKFPEDEEKGEVVEEIIEQGKDIGLNFNYDIMLTGNTNNIHRISKYAKLNGKDKEFVDEIMEGYFTNGFDLNSNEEIFQITDKLNLNREDIEKILNSDEFSDEVKQDKYDAFQYQVKSIPFFMFDNRYGASGKQDVKVFEDALKQLAEFKNIEK